MYRYRYINQHSQFGRTTCTLILEDLEGNMPLIRIDKEFAASKEDLDQELLYQEARKEILLAQQNYDNGIIEATNQTASTPEGDQ